MYGKKAQLSVSQIFVIVTKSVLCVSGSTSSVAKSAYTSSFCKEARKKKKEEEYFGGMSGCLQEKNGGSIPYN